MSSQLPTAPSLDKIVQDFGLGLFDSDPSTVKEDSSDVKSELNPRGVSLPDGGGPEVDPPELLSSYAVKYNSENHLLTEDDVDTFYKKVSQFSLPGDIERPSIRSYRPNEDTIQPLSSSGLPHDENNPPARADTYDISVSGSLKKNSYQTSPYWPNDSNDIYGGNKVQKNEVKNDNYLNGIGNYWSGYVEEDVSGPNGFPSTDFVENVDYPKSNDGSLGGSLMASDSIRTNMNKVSTNTALVRDLVSAFLKEYGKKNLTRRHVMKFLKSINSPQYLASDIIRCIGIENNIIIKDVLDEFAIADVLLDGRNAVSSIRQSVFDMEVSSFMDSEANKTIRRLGASLADVLALIERVDN